jgi:hypothetical protein
VHCDVRKLLTQTAVVGTLQKYYFIGIISSPCHLTHDLRVSATLQQLYQKSKKSERNKRRFIGACR